MKLNKILLATVGIALLNGCSTHTTTNLNKIRTAYTNDKNQIKIDDISNERQKSINFDKPTAYAQGIACLSSPYLQNMKTNNENTKNEEIQKKMGQIREINRLENEIKQIFKTGNYVKQSISYTKTPEGDFYFQPNGTINPNTLIIKTEKVYQKSMEDLKLDIALLDYQISKNPKNAQQLLVLREKMAYEFEELNTELKLKENELAEIKRQQQNTDKILSDMGKELANADDVYKVAVADIYDKTGKIFPAESTAISEMVAHALSYNAGIKLVDIPFGDRWNSSRYNPLSDVNKNQKSLNNQILSPNMGFAGVVFPSDMYISGALVQYDELPMIRPFGTRISLNIDPLDLSTDTRTINVGMVLRAVGSLNALVLDNSNIVDKQQGDRASVYVQNTYFVKKIGANIFEVKSKRLYGGNFTVEVADPATYVVKEMVEAGMYQLLKKTIRPHEMSIQDKKRCDDIVENALIQKDTSKTI